MCRGTSIGEDATTTALVSNDFDRNLHNLLPTDSPQILNTSNISPTFQRKSPDSKQNGSPCYL